MLYGPQIKLYNAKDTNGLEHWKPEKTKRQTGKQNGLLWQLYNPKLQPWSCLSSHSSVSWRPIITLQMKRPVLSKNLGIISSENGANFLMEDWHCFKFWNNSIMVSHEKNNTQDVNRLLFLCALTHCHHLNYLWEILYPYSKRLETKAQLVLGYSRNGVYPL